MLSALLAQATSVSTPEPGWGAIIALGLFIAASVWLGLLAQKVVERSQFIQGYFQGNRGLGPWAIALTATVQSGGTFMGFPSLVYSYGWIVALWIGSYTVVPINPHERVVEGERAYASVLDYPGTIDEATVYVPPAIGLQVVDQIAGKGIRKVWLNPGADARQVVERARSLELQTVVACSIVGIGESPGDY